MIIKVLPSLKGLRPACSSRVTWKLRDFALASPLFDTAPLLGLAIILAQVLARNEPVLTGPQARSLERAGL